MLIYSGLERSELASASAKQKQLIAAIFDALLPSRPWFCPRKPRALPPVSGEAGCGVVLFLVNSRGKGIALVKAER